MPSINNKSAHRYWFQYVDPTIYKVVTFMESVENWTLDGETTLEESLKKLGDALEELGRIELQAEDKFIELLTYLKAARMLYIMQCLDTAYPGSASKLLTHSEQTSLSNEDAAGLFLRRNIVFERLRLLTRVFSPNRLSLVSKALEEGV